MKSNESYSVVHEENPGDMGNMLVSFASYHEYKKLGVRYRIYGKRDENQKNVHWFLEEPINLRECLGKDFHRRAEIAERTISYLKANDFKSSWPYADFSNIQVDSQLVRTLSQHIVHRIKQKFQQYARHLPSPTVLVLIFVCWLQLQLLPMIGQRIVGLHQAYAIIIALAMLSDIRKDYSNCEIIALLTLMRSKRSRGDKQMTMIKYMFRLHKIKYTISICLVLYFWLYG